MPTSLRNLVLSRIDLVDVPANPGSRVVLVKRDDLAKRIVHRDGKYVVTSEDGSKTLGTHSTHADALSQLRAIEANKAAAPGIGSVHVNSPYKGRSSPRSAPVTMKSIMKRLAEIVKEGGEQSFLPGSPEHEGAEMSHIDALANLHKSLGEAISGFGDPAQHPPEHPVHKLMEMHKALGEHLAAQKPPEGEGDPMVKDDVAMAMKALDKRTSDTVAKAMEDIQKKLDAATTRADAAETIAKAERATRELSEVKVDLQKFHHVTIDIEKDAPVFKKLKDSDPAAYAAVLEKLNAAEAVAKTARKLEQDLGSQRGDETGGSAWAKIEAEATKMVEKNTTLTKAQAINKVMETRTDLVKEYYDESGRNDPKVAVQ